MSPMETADISVDTPEITDITWRRFPREIAYVSVDTPTTFTVRGLDEGNTRIRLTASHPDYESASMEVTVSVYLQPLEVVISPSPLGVVIGMSETFTVAVEEGVRAVIWMRSATPR